MAIMQKQNEITAALTHQQRLLSLPTREIPIFAIHFNIGPSLRHLSKDWRIKLVELTVYTTWNSSLEGSQRNWFVAANICLLNVVILWLRVF